MKKLFLILVVVLFYTSCKSAYQTSEFKFETAPPAPDYSSKEHWVVLPKMTPPAVEEVTGPLTLKKADVFFIYPTLFVSRKDSTWNADYRNPFIRKEVIEKSAALQATAWCAAANLYMPFYRQAHYRIFVEPFAKQGREAGLLAYRDIKAAFEYYLKHYNKGKPIIIAAHSQGALHAKKIIQEFFDDKPLQKNLIAAYLIGVKITETMFNKLPKLTEPHTTGGFVSWNSYKRKKLPNRYNEWYKGGVTTNPISWNSEKYTDRKAHLGVLNSDKKIYPQSISIEVIDGMIWATVPKIPKRFFLSFIKNYHFADINLFWADIQKNAQIRTQTWFKQNH